MGKQPDFRLRWNDENNEYDSFYEKLMSKEHLVGTVRPGSLFYRRP